MHYQEVSNLMDLVDGIWEDTVHIYFYKNLTLEQENIFKSELLRTYKEDFENYKDLILLLKRMEPNITNSEDIKVRFLEKGKSLEIYHFYGGSQNKKPSNNIRMALISAGISNDGLLPIIDDWAPKKAIQEEYYTRSLDVKIESNFEDLIKPKETSKVKFLNKKN